MEALNMDVLNNIKPFSGTPEEMPGERLISEGKALQRVQTQYTTAVAVQKPRSIAKVTANVLEEAKLAGSAFYYRWEVMNRKTNKKSVVQGPSIDLAMAIARNYGNCAVDIEGTETPTHYMFKGVFIDLETGFTVPRLYRQRKNQAIGKFEDDRAEDVVFQIGQSKAQRNAITKAAPGWLVDQAIEEARQAEINKIKPENLHLARGKVLDFFATYGVTQERMEAKIGRKADLWTAEDIADLRGSATALKEGRIGPDELFPPNDDTAPEAQEPATIPPEEVQAKRKRRTKAEMEADKKAPETVTEPPLAEPPKDSIEPEDFPPSEPGDPGPGETTPPPKEKKFIWCNNREDRIPLEACVRDVDCKDREACDWKQNVVRPYVKELKTGAMRESLELFEAKDWTDIKPEHRKAAEKALQSALDKQNAGNGK